MENRNTEQDPADRLPVKSGETQREEYIRLLLEKERLQKECAQLSMEYDRIFGPLILEEFQAKIDVATQKIELSLYIQVMNHGQEPDPEEIGKVIRQRTDAWQKELEEMKEYQNALRKSRPVPSGKMRQIRRLYRQLAKRIHPDLHPGLENDPRIRELWNRLQTAYRCNSLEDMEETAALVDQTLTATGTVLAAIPDLAEKTEKLRQEISRITATDPWLYTLWICEPEEVRQRQEEYKDTIRTLKEARRQLAAQLETLLMEWKGDTCLMN